MYLFLLAKLFNLLLPANLKAEDLSLLLRPMLEYKTHKNTIIEWGDIVEEDEDDEIDPDFVSLMDHKDIRMLS